MKKVFTTTHEWEAILTCIYEASNSRVGHQNISLRFEPISQYDLFCEYIHVEADIDKAKKVMEAICGKISPYVYYHLAYTAMGYEEDLLDTLYRVLLLGFHFGPKVLQMEQYQDVMRCREIYTRVANEAHSFREFVRFQALSPSLYVAHISPKSYIVTSLGPHFQNRMPSENWMIIDDVHRQAIIHVQNKPYYFRSLSEEEYESLLETEQNRDTFTDLWQVFFDNIAIKERTNKACQRNLFPVWKRKHAVEFK